MPSSSMDRMPNDIIFMIFMLVLLSSRPPQDYRELYKLRAKIMATYRGWFAFLIHEPIFWSYIEVTSKSDPAAAVTHLKRSGGARLNFRLMFNLRTRSYAEDLMETVNTLLDPLKPYFERAVAFRIETNHPFIMANLRKRFRRTYVPIIKTLAIRYSYARRERDDWAFVDDENIEPALWFGGEMRELQELAIESITMPFDRVKLPSLRIARITSSKGRTVWKEKHIRELVSGSTMLEELFMGRTKIIERGEGEINSPSIKTLGILFAGDGSTTALARSLVLPNLTKGVLSLTTKAEVTEATSCAQTFAACKTLRILSVLYGQDASSIHTLFDAFSWIEHLDLRKCRANVFTQLVKRSRASVVNDKTSTLPKLKTICLPQVSSAAIRDFVTLHGEGQLEEVSTATCEHYAPVTERIQNNRTWIAAHVSEFTIEREDGGAFKVTVDRYIEL
ncbi:hypothetical protein B0H11DRAFT_1931645 [Mycena galericulata]|nr:hypothetical protein B0H11DRAFT_1931645 [Mycena galericulata]